MLCASQNVKILQQQLRTRATTIKINLWQYHSVKQYGYLENGCIIQDNSQKDCNERQYKTVKNGMKKYIKYYGMGQQTC